MISSMFGAKELLGRAPQPPTLQQHVEHSALVIDRTPQLVAFATDRAEHFIKMPCIACLCASLS
jgi:hypothetical protein